MQPEGLQLLAEHGEFDTYRVGESGVAARVPALHVGLTNATLSGSKSRTHLDTPAPAPE